MEKKSKNRGKAKAMNRFLRNIVPVILVIYFTVFVMGQGWGEENQIYHSDNINAKDYKANISHEVRTNGWIWPLVPEFRVFKGIEFDLIFHVESLVLPKDLKIAKIEIVESEKYKDNIIVLTSEAGILENDDLSKEMESERVETYREIERKESVRKPGIENLHLQQNIYSKVQYHIKLKALNISKNHIKWRIVLPNNEEQYYYTEIWVMPGWDLSNLIFYTGFLVSGLALSIRLILSIPIPLFILSYPDLAQGLSTATQYGINMMGISFVTFIGYEIVVHNYYMNNYIKETK